MGRLVAALKAGTGDCVVNWLGARAFERGIDPYSPEGLRWAGLHLLGHPPTTTLWFLPFTGYGIYDLNQAVGHLLLLMLLIHFVLLAAELRAPVPVATALLGYAVVSSTTWWQYHVQMMQLSEPIAFSYLLAWILLRRNHEIAAGILIGLAMTLKPYAALLVVLLLVARRWRGALAAACVYAAAVVIVTARFGFRCWREFAAMLPESQSTWTANLHNASVQGIVLRWWWPAGHGPVLAQATALATLISAAIVFAIAWQSRRAVTRPDPAPAIDEAIDLPFAMFVVASAWLNPVVWEHYDVTLIQPMAIALFAAWRLEGRRARAYAIGAIAILVGVGLLLSIDMNAKNDPRPLMRHLYEVANWLPWPLVLGTCAILLWRRQRATASVSG